MLFPPGDTRFQERRSRWREIEFMYHEICAVLLPPVNLTRTLVHWNEIAQLLSDSKRNRVRQPLLTTLLGTARERDSNPENQNVLA
jgi:hypothetical protein